MTIKKNNAAKTGKEAKAGLKSGPRKRDAFSVRAKWNLMFAGLGAIMLVFADQGAKLAASAGLHERLELMPFVSLKYAENTGIAWSIQLPYVLLLTVNFFLVGFFFWWAMKSLDFRKWLTVAAVALVTAGAFGNIIDRIRLGFVVDFISVGFWPVFNLADAFLSIGIFLILLFYAKITGTG